MAITQSNPESRKGQSLSERLPLKIKNLQRGGATYPEPGVQGGRLRSGTGWTPRDRHSIGSRVGQPIAGCIGSRYLGARMLAAAGLKFILPGITLRASDQKPLPHKT